MRTRRQFLATVGGVAAVSAQTKLGPPAIGANTAISGMGMLEAIGLVRSLQFPVIEIHAMGSLQAVEGQFPGFEFDRISDGDKVAIRKALNGFRQITAHLPYTGLDYFAADTAKASAAVRRVDVGIEGCAHFGVSLAVIHPKPGAGQTPDQERKTMVEQFRRWGDLAARSKLRLALETGYPKSIPAFAGLIDEIAHPAVGATLDVGHQSQYAELASFAKDGRGTPAAIRAYNDVNLQIVERLGKKLFHLHVHDIDPQSWKEHQPMGTGFVDYPRLIAKLRAIGYSGALVLEIAGPAARMPDHLRNAKRQLTDFLV